MSDKKGFLPAIFGDSRERKVQKDLALIKTNVQKLNQDGKKLGSALQTLNTNVALIDKTIEDLKAADYSKVKTFINHLDLDEEYKAELNKEIDESKEEAVKTLTPIKEASEKIRGNMAVSMIKYQNMTRSLIAQKNIIESGTIQVETIERAKEMGGFNADKIAELVERAEEINKVTRGAVLDYKKSTFEMEKSMKGMGAGEDVLDVFTIK